MSPVNDNPEDFEQTAPTVSESSAKQGRGGIRTFQIFLVSTGAAAVALLIAFVIATVAS